jgi:predicted RNA polymerase sigma factor
MTFRDEWPRLVAAAMRIVGNLGAAEDVAAEAMVPAVDHWPRIASLRAAEAVPLDLDR